jgi:hypothetical protein
MKSAIQIFPRNAARVTVLPFRSVKEKSGTDPYRCKPSLKLPLLPNCG